ncbi:hypothetical protein AB0F17_12925 [Nonomuraea sp. NPDC026600]|uniref:hypothetical protein n=1 Tax=Nonomuraea sp. NPDC026600 TaxID=3155363 RepID=UPI0033E8B69C
MAVFEGRVDNARALVSAGADPWRLMMGGWSPRPPQPGRPHSRPLPHPVTGDRSLRGRGHHRGGSQMSDPRAGRLL